MTRKSLFRATALSICTLAGFAAYTPVKADDDMKKYSGSIISAEEASKIAVEHTGGTVVEVDFDDDDSSNNNKPVFEVEVMKDGVEHEVKIDAATGNIVNSKIDD